MTWNGSEQAALDAHGWVIHQTDNSDKDMTTLAAALGPCIKPARGDLRQLLQATASADARPNTYSSRFGLDSFPFHTDMANWTTPPRYVLLRHHSGESSIPTVLLDSLPLLDSLGRGLFERGLWSARGSRRRFVCNVLSLRHRAILFRWDAHFMKPETDLAKSASNAFVDIIDERRGEGQVFVHLGTQSAILVIDNWRVMHARPEIPDTAKSRTLERLLVADGQLA